MLNPKPGHFKNSTQNPGDFEISTQNPKQNFGFELGFYRFASKNPIFKNKGDVYSLSKVFWVSLGSETQGRTHNPTKNPESKIFDQNPAQNPEFWV